MKRFKKQPMRLHLGRTMDESSTFSNYQISSRKRDWSKKEGFGEGFIASFCGDEFEKVTGIRLEKGEVVRVRITVEDA